MRSATIAISVVALFLAASAASAQVIFTTDYASFVANTQPLSTARWDTKPFGPVAGNEFMISDGLVFQHLSGTGLQNQDDVGDQGNQADTTADANGLNFKYGLSTNDDKPANTDIRINRQGTGAPGFTALGIWVIDAEIYRSPDSDDNGIVLTTEDDGTTQTPYDLSELLPPWVSGGTTTNVLFFGFYVADPVADSTRITQLDLFLGNSNDGNEQSSIGQVEYSDEVPEPATMALMGLGAGGLAVLRRRRRK